MGTRSFQMQVIQKSQLDTVVGHSINSLHICLTVEFDKLRNQMISEARYLFVGVQ